MSNYLAIATVTSALQKLILQGLRSAPWSFPYDLVVTTAPLNEARSSLLDAVGQINLYLYHASPNAAWRNQPVPNQSKGGESGFPPLALDLRYLITAFAPENNGVEAHRLLGCALSVLHDHAVLSSKELAGAMPNSDVHEQADRVRLSLLNISTEEMASLWNSFQKAYHISVAWQVSLVLLESRRAVRAALPVLTRAAAGVSGGDTAMTVTPTTTPVVPSIDAVLPPAQQSSAHLGEILTLAGHLLAGAEVRVAFSQARWSTPKDLLPATVSAGSVAVKIPSGSGAEDDWSAGHYSVFVRVTRRLGETARPTNELPFTLAPVITALSPKSGKPVAGVLALSVSVSPKVWIGQRVLLIVGDQTFEPQAPTAKTDSLQFSLKGLSPGIYRLRLRVDGVDSPIVNKTTTPPSFVGPELEVL